MRSPLMTSALLSLAALAALLAPACSSAATPGTFAEKVEAAHGSQSLYEKEALHGDLIVDFGGQRMLEARMIHDAASGRVRLEYAEGKVAVFDGEAAWAQGFSAEELPMVRFHLLTWPYFVAAPWKLADPGTHMGPVEPRKLQGKDLEAARLTFEAGAGDTPEDWYVVYADPADGRLAALAYIVTYGTTVEKAEGEPHAATYDDLTEIDGLRVPTRLRFWAWNATEGIVGEPIGEMRFTDLHFAKVPEPMLEAPEGAVRAEMPR